MMIAQDRYRNLETDKALTYESIATAILSEELKNHEQTDLNVKVQIAGWAETPRIM